MTNAGWKFLDRSRKGCQVGEAAVKGPQVWLFLVVFLFTGNLLFAQKWGELSPEERALTFLPEDSAAEAVILFDRQEVKITENFQLAIKRHRRMKILTEKGREYADVRLPFDRDDKIMDLQAQTIHPDGKKIKVNDKEIFEELRQVWKRKVFAFPAVEVGSVMEYKYEVLRKDLAFLEPWFFQNEEYTHRSQLTVEVLPGFEYSVLINRLIGINPEFKEDTSFGFGGKQRKIFTWKLENIPALKSEPYATNLKDHFTSLRFQLVSYTSPYGQRIDFIGTWKDIGENFRKWYGEFLKDDSELKKLARGLAPEATADSVRAKAVYDYVRRQIETSGSAAFFAERKPAQVERQKEGSAVEKNFLLKSLLRAAGLEAYPVLISTRDNGKLVTRWPFLFQFNHLIVACPIGSRTFLLDTRSPYCPFGTLPLEDLVEDGLAIYPDRAELIKLQPYIPASSRTATTEADLDGEGGLKCRIRLRFEGYEAVTARRELWGEKKEEYVKNLLRESFADAVLDSFHIAGEDSVELPLEMMADFRQSAFLQFGGETGYLRLPLLFLLKSNPFTTDERNLPIEIGYAFHSQEIVAVRIPDASQIVEIPKDVRIDYNQARFSSFCRVEGNTVRCERNFGLGKVVFPTKEYPNLRKLYEQRVSSEQGQIVLKR